MDLNHFQPNDQKNAQQNPRSQQNDQQNSQKYLIDVFTKVIDNLGDVGVGCRLVQWLLDQGHQVRWWLDQPQALTWMAPSLLWHSACQLYAWPQVGDALHLPVASLWIETFGCGIPETWLSEQLSKSLANPLKSNKIDEKNQALWINIEYLSCESYVERTHLLPSLVSSGVGHGCVRWFYYPGFTIKTGGLLRRLPHPTLTSKQRQAWWQALPNIKLESNKPNKLNEINEIDEIDEIGTETWVSIFCYPYVHQATLAGLIARCFPKQQPIVWLAPSSQINLFSPKQRARVLPFQTQTSFDEMLALCNMNVVRGEDSWVSAVIAGRPFLWHIYYQEDGAHIPKLHAFLDWYKPPPRVRQLFLELNQVISYTDDDPLTLEEFILWEQCAQEAKQRLEAQDDLGTQLMIFVEKRFKAMVKA